MDLKQRNQLDKTEQNISMDTSFSWHVFLISGISHIVILVICNGVFEPFRLQWSAWLVMTTIRSGGLKAIVES